MPRNHIPVLRVRVVPIPLVLERCDALVPELILGPPGLVDDIALSAYVLHDLLESTDPGILREHWEGSADILDLIRQILSAADAMVGGPVWRQLLARARGFAGPI